MNVVFATGIFPPDIGGPATSVSMLAEAWAAEGHRVSVVTYSDVGDDGVPRAYKVRRISRAQPAWRRYFAYAKALWEETRAPGPVFAQDAVASGLPALVVSSFRRRKLVLKVVGDFAWEHAQVQEGYAETLERFQKDWRLAPRLWLLRALQRRVARAAGMVIVPSRYLAGVVKGWGVPESRVAVVYNGTRPIGEGKPIERRPRRIVAAGRMVPWKNLDVPIKAMTKILARVPDAELVIVGDGPEGDRLRSLARAPMIRGKVSFAGRMSREDLGALLAGSGVFVLPSSYEGFSHQLVEAFMCGTPTVASRAGGNPELVEDGKNGLLVAPGDVDGLADAVVRLLTDRAFAERCAAEARKDLGRFTVEAQVAATSDAVLGPPGGIGVVIVGRDGTVADPSSRSAARMALYGRRVGRLSVVAFARRQAASARLSENATAEVLEARQALFRPWRAIGAIRSAIRAAKASVVMAQDPFEVGLFALLAARLEGVPVVVEEHGGFYLGPYWRRESPKNALRWPLGLLVMRAADGLRAVSAKIEADLKRRFPKKPVVRVPVFTEPIACRPTGEPHVFGFVGRFVPQKNLEGLLAAFHRVAREKKEARLVMAGAGPLEAALKARAAEEGVGDRVDWIAHTERVADAYGKIGTLVLPSWYEGWGRVVIEAMRCGIPTVMTDVGCANEAMRNGVEGYVVGLGDAESFARAMLTAAEPWTHKMMSVAAARRAETLEGPDALADRLAAFWREIAGQGKPVSEPEG